MLDRITLGGLVLAMVILWIWNWAVMQKLQRHDERLLENDGWAAWVEGKLKEVNRSTEQRCQHCQEGPRCPGYDTGVKYPCPHFKENMVQ